MAEITQRFSIDVTGAISALDALDARMKAFGTALVSLGNNLKKFNSAARKAFDLGGAGQKAADASNRAKKAFDALFTSSSKLNKVSGTAAAGFTKTAAAISKTGRAATQAAGPLQRIGSLGNTAFKGLFGSVSQLSRIIGTRILIQGFGAIQQAIKGAVTSAAALQKAVREVATILPEGQANADNLTASVRRLSDAFNLPISAVTEGLYQAVSNQIGDAATSLGFLETAAKFAKTAVTDIDTSVNLLSGTINAFGLTAGDTEAIADKLFKTIELGRTRASELANSLGRVLPVASELGISLDEVLAGFATVTIAGIKTSEATTQLRGALNALLKPTQATKDLLAELGFTSGEALIQARGLQGAFQAMSDAAGGSVTALSKFIPRVRGLNAALILAGSGADRFQENLRLIREQSAGLLGQKFELVIESNAEQVANTVNRLKNLFTVELGNSLLETLAKFTQLIGGVDQLGAALKTIAPIAVALTATIGALALGLFAFNTVASVAIGLAGSLGISLAALGVAAAVALAPLAAFAALSFAENRRIAAINAELEAVKEKNRQELDFEKKQNAAAIALRIARSRELNAILQEEIAEFNKGFQKRVDANKKANDEIIADNKRVVNSIIAAGEAIVKATQKRITDEQSIQKDSVNAQRDAAKELSDFEFEARNKNFNQLQQFSNLQERANQQRREAQRLVQLASGADATKDDIERARAAFERAQSTAAEAQGIAEQLGNRAAIFQIENTTLDILRNKVRAEEQITRASERREVLAKARLGRQREELDNIKELAKEILNAPSLFDDSGAALAGEAQAEAIQRRQEALTNFRRALASSKELSIDQIIDFSQLSSNLDKQLTAADLQTLTVNSAAFTKLRSDINDNLEGFRAEFGAILTTLEVSQDIRIINPAELSTALGEQLTLERQVLQIDTGLSERLSAVRKELDGLNVSLSQIEPASENVFSALGVGASLLLDTFTGNRGATQTFATGLGQINSQLFSLAEQFRNTGTLTTAQVEQVQQLTSKFRELGGVADAPLGGGGAATLAQNLLTSLNDVAIKLGEIRQLQSQAAAEGGTAEQLQRNQAASQAAEQAAGAEATKRREAAEAARQVSTETGTAAVNTRQAANAAGQAANNAGTLATNTNAAANAAERFAEAIASGGGGATATAQMGRFFPRFLADGGFASRGTDTIPAMLSPGEFIVNARSSKRFYSQLQAINAGRQPVYRQDGGPVTNVGDINVTVGEGKDGPSTGRQIARSIRRELRRGTSSL